MSIQYVGLLETVAITMSIGALIPSLLSLVRLYRAEKKLSSELHALAERKHALAKLQKLQCELMSLDNTAIPNKKLQAEFEKMLDEAIHHLKHNEARLIQNGIKQSSLAGQRNYEKKLLNMALMPHRAH